MRRVERFDRTRNPLRPEHFVSLRFDGSVEPRALHGKSEFRGTLFFAETGDLVFSKIDVRNGAIGLIPGSIPRAAVTSEFPVYRVKPEASPEYLILLTRSAIFRDAVNALVSGTSGRKRVTPEAFEALRIPLPPLATQRAIVAQWQKSQSEIAAARARADAIEAKARAAFLADLGLREPGAISTRKAFALDFARLDRWGVDFNARKIGSMDLDAGKFPVGTLGEHIGFLQYGSSEKATAKPGGVPILRMGNLQEGEIDFTGLKYLSPNARDLARLRLLSGDLIFNRTNSKELVGKCAVFTTQSIDYVFASYLIRVRTVADQLDPHFAACALNGPIGRQQIDAMSRRILGQANINSQEIRQLRLPLPPLATQQALAAAMTAARAEAARERAAAGHLTTTADTTLESALLGNT